jgi:hypothetical protein
MMAQPSVSTAYTFDKFWLPNDADIFTVELTPTMGPGSLYMYDWEEGQDDSLFLLSDGDYEGRTVYFTQDEPTGTWFADVTLGGKTLDLGDTQKFGFYFSDASTDPYSYYLSYELKEVTVDDDYRLYVYDSNTLMKVAVHDATPIPFPASALLLASGIVGLIAFGRVRRIS